MRTSLADRRERVESRVRTRPLLCVRRRSGWPRSSPARPRPRPTIPPPGAARGPTALAMPSRLHRLGGRRRDRAPRRGAASPTRTWTTWRSWRTGATCSCRAIRSTSTGAAVRSPPERGRRLRRGRAVAPPRRCPRRPSRSRDEGTVAVDLPFAFPFYGQPHRDASSCMPTAASPSARPTAAAASAASADSWPAAPVAAFFADLDPARGGSVTARVSADRAVLVWSAVPGGGQINRNTFQIVLHASGEIDLVYGDDAEPGGGGRASPPGGALELTARRPLRGHAARRRAARSSSASARRRSWTSCPASAASTRPHADVFEQVVVYTTRPLNPVPGTPGLRDQRPATTCTGIGLEIVDARRRGAARAAWRASSTWTPSTPTWTSDGFEILGHEVGHRWLARLRFRDGGRRASPPCSAAAACTGASSSTPTPRCMEGNDIARPRRRPLRDRGLRAPATARSTSTSMGLRARRRGAAVLLRGRRRTTSGPTGSFKAVSAPRRASASRRAPGRPHRGRGRGDGTAPCRPHGRATRLRQAFVLVSDDVAPATDVRRAAVARIRRRFEAYYRRRPRAAARSERPCPECPPLHESACLRTRRPERPRARQDRRG